MADRFIFFASAVFDFNILFLEANWKTLFRKLCASHFYTRNSIFTLCRIMHFVGRPLPFIQWANRKCFLSLIWLMDFIDIVFQWWIIASYYLQIEVILKLEEMCSESAKEFSPLFHRVGILDNFWIHGCLMI